MKCCDECKEELEGTAVSLKWSYPSRLFDGEVHEFCSDRCFFAWGAKQVTRFEKLLKNPYAELYESGYSPQQIESITRLKKWEKKENKKGYGVNAK